MTPLRKVASIRRAPVLKFCPLGLGSTLDPYRVLKRLPTGQTGQDLCHYLSQCLVGRQKENQNHGRKEGL